MRSIVINNAELGSGVIFCYCRAFILFRKGRTSLCHDSWPKFWMSDLTAEVPYITKSDNEQEIESDSDEKKFLLVFEFLIPEKYLSCYQDKRDIAYF